jgi:phosphatidylglycerophosphatase A
VKPDFRFLVSHPAHFIALGLGSGLAPKAPGTFGSLAAVPLYWLLLQANASLPFVLVATAGAFLLGIWACGVAGQNMGVADPGSIVWDEIVAMWLVLAFTPADFLWWMAAFGLFRFFDILKPWPIRWFDAHIKNGFGIMFDDLLAALYALLALKVWTGLGQ